MAGRAQTLLVARSYLTSWDIELNDWTNITDLVRTRDAARPR